VVITYLKKVKLKAVQYKC